MSVFDKTVDRRGTCSLKWDVKEGELPMWVADMDFETAPAVKEAVAERAAHGAYGYNVLPDEWYDAICSWWKDRHGTVIRRDELCFCTGAVPAISCLVKRLTNIGDEVVVMTPAYDIFFHSIENAGRHTVESPLAYDGESYAIDFDDLAEKLSRPLVRLLILCDPHNPTGNIWTKEELARIGELCKAHGVTVISDELHCDLTDPGFDYVPFASASDTCAEVSITCISASKAFNLAGLQSAAVWSRNKNLLDIAVRGLNSDELAEPNSFAAVATAAAFGKGGGWLDELRAYLAENKRLAREYVSREISGARAVASHATYLVWIDMSRITDDSAYLASFIREKTGLYLSDGSRYRGDGRRFLRLNAACPRSVLEDGLARLERGLRLYGER